MSRPKPNRIKQITEQTIADLKTLGLYRSEFIPVIERYAETRTEYETARSDWERSGRELVGERRAGNGIYFEGLAPQYRLLQRIRRELAEQESTLGLNPQSYKKITGDKGEPARNNTRFEDMIHLLEESARRADKEQRESEGE